MKSTDAMEEAYRIYLNNAYKAAETQFEWSKWCSWARGSMVLEGGVEAIPEFPAIPNKIDIAKSVLELLMQPMITLWCYNWEKQESRTAKEIVETRQIALENVQTLLGTLSSEIVAINLILDAEFTWVLNKSRESSAYYIGMFHQRYRECVLKKKIVEWRKLKTPIKDWSKDFMNICKKNEYIGLSPEHSLALFSVIPDAQKRMFDDFQKVLKEENRGN
jgi:hypothetical protein